MGSNQAAACKKILAAPFVEEIRALGEIGREENLDPLYEGGLAQLSGSVRVSRRAAQGLNLVTPGFKFSAPMNGLF